MFVYSMLLILLGFSVTRAFELSPAVTALGAVLAWIGMGYALDVLTSKRRRYITDFYTKNQDALLNLECTEEDGLMLRKTIGYAKAITSERTALNRLAIYLTWPAWTHLLDILTEVARHYEAVVDDGEVIRLKDKLAKAGFPLAVDGVSNPEKGIDRDGVWVQRDGKVTDIVTVFWVRSKGDPASSLKKYQAMLGVLKGWGGGEDVISTSMPEANFIWKNKAGATFYLGAVRTIAIYAPSRKLAYSDPIKYFMFDFFKAIKTTFFKNAKARNNIEYTVSREAAKRDFEKLFLK